MVSRAKSLVGYHHLDTSGGVSWKVVIFFSFFRRMFLIWFGRPKNEIVWNYVKIGTWCTEAKDLWQKIVNLRRLKYLNVCTLTGILIAISTSNSSVEHAFSIFTNTSSSRCLSMKHKRMELMLIIGANDQNWNDIEEKSINWEHSTFISKQLKKKLNFQKVNLQVKLYCWDQKRAASNVYTIAQLAQIILKILIFSWLQPQSFGWWWTWR